MKLEIIKIFLRNNYGIIARKILPINKGVINKNYYIQSNQGDFLFKVYQQINKTELEFEVGIYYFLQKKRFPAPRIKKSLERKDYSKLRGKFCILFKYISGETIKNINQQKMFIIGTLQARMHKLLKQYKYKKVKKQHWEPSDIAEMISQQGPIVARRRFHNSSRLVSFIQDEFKKLEFPFYLPKGITHQDVKPENIIENKGKISFIDFNNCYHGVLLYDLMTPVIWICFPRDKFNANLFISFLSGYQRIRKLKREECLFLLGALKFRLLREAFVWPMRWLDAELAPKYGWMFVRRYRNLVKNEENFRKKIKNICRV